MLSAIKTHFPSTKGSWIKYTLTSLPIIFAAMILSINSFIDNFMATSISGGNQSLSYANQWTQYCTGIISATTLVGSSLFGQYLGLQDKSKIREVVRARMLIAFIIAFIFFIPGLFSPHFLINVSSGFDKNLDSKIVENAVNYMRIITFSWLLQAFFYTYSMIIREAGYGNISLVASLISLFMNILFNSLFTFVLNFGIYGLAISTIISLIAPIIFIILFLFFRSRILILNPLKIFSISKLVWIQIGNRFSTFILATIGSICVSTRFIFWNIGYETGKIGSNPDFHLSAANILGISGMFFNIFWTTFESINANVAIFVGRELGNNNYEKAKQNAKELQGFHLTFALVLGSLLFSLSFAIEHMSFLTKGYLEQLKEIVGNEKFELLKNDASKEYLENLKWTIWPLSWNMPLWIWYITKSRIISGGGRTNIVSLVDACSGLIQIGWISIINFIIVPNSNIAFPWAYSIFFLSDILKVPLFEILYRKVQWAKNITMEGTVAKSLEN